MKEAPVRVGEVLAGKYRVEAILGAGGMGAVVEATHLELGERRAIKLMLPSVLHHADAVARFLREARASSRLRGEHVAHVHDVGRLDDGAPYIVLEYLEGQDLRDLVKERGRLPVHEAVHHVLQACEGLAEAHAAGIVHRDLKPANLFLTRRLDGTSCLKILDFGVSKIVGRGEMEMTSSQTVLGSPSYMSPEQMRSSRDVDARADVWSLGVILYKLVTGEFPFRGDNITEIVSAVLAARPEPPSVHAPSLPPGLDALVLRCLERDVARRYASVADLAAALAPFAADEEGPVSARRVARVLGASSGPVSNARPSLVSVANEITPTPDVTTLPVPIASAQGTVAVRAWKLWALVAACGVLSVAFAASLVARGSARTAEARGPSADLGEGAGAALPAARPAASAQVDRPTASSSASSSASVAAVDAPMPSAIATAAASSKVAPKPAPARSAKVTAAPPARSVVEEAPKPPPPPPAPVTHRVFGSED